MNNEITYFVGAFFMIMVGVICSLESYVSGGLVLMWIGLAHLIAHLNT